MSLTEQARHHLITKATEALDREAAMSLAELLPPVGWADVATRRDLDVLEERMGYRLDLLESRVGRRFEHLDARFDAIDARFEVIGQRFDAKLDGLESRMGAELHRVTGQLTRALVLVVVALAGAFVAALQLAG